MAALTRIAVVYEGVVVDVVNLPVDMQGLSLGSLYHPALGKVDISSRTDIQKGWKYDGVTFTAPAS